MLIVITVTAVLLNAKSQYFTHSSTTNWNLQLWTPLRRSSGGGGGGGLLYKYVSMGICGHYRYTSSCHIMKRHAFQHFFSRFII